MRSHPLATCLLALCLATAPVMPALAQARAISAETAPRPASADELAGYADREEEAKQEKLDDFEGGRRGRGGIQATTIIIVLLVVILVVILV